MATSDFFAETYAAARENFLSAARAARCDLSKYPLRNHTGPYGEELTIDVGKLGPAEPQVLLVLISGTHGVEGFCGSGCRSWQAGGRLLPAGANAAEYDFKLASIARATSAAPTFFAPARIRNKAGQSFTMIDGGVFANNPTMCAIVEAKHLERRSDA